MYELKMNNLLVDVGILSFVLNKLHFKQSFSNICRNRCPLFSQINFNQTFFWGVGFVLGVSGMEGFCLEGLCLGVYLRGIVCLGDLCPKTNRITSHPSEKGGTS